MNKNNLSSIILTILVLVALAVGVVLVKQTQEVRRGASFTTVTLNLLPSTQITAKVGDTFPVHVNYVAVPGKLVDAVQATVCYGSEVSVAAATASTDLGFDANPMVVDRTIDNKTCTTVIMTATQPTSKLKDTSEVGKIFFAGNSAGNGKIEVMVTNSVGTTESMVTGSNPGSLDKEVTVTAANGTSYSIIGRGTGTGPTLNFKVTFAGIRASAKCADQMTAGLIVAGVGESKVFGNMALTRTTDVGPSGFTIYTGSKVLSGFTTKTGVAVYLKGMKHLQMKYSLDNQKGPYNSPGGKLDLSGTKVYDFSDYPMLAGDVNQDGLINAKDFSLLGDKIQSHETVAEGSADSIFDLDGNCQLNTIDIGVLANSLNEKQGELY